MKRPGSDVSSWALTMRRPVSRGDFTGVGTPALTKKGRTREKKSAGPESGPAPCFFSRAGLFFVRVFLPGRQSSLGATCQAGERRVRPGSDVSGRGATCGVPPVPTPPASTPRQGLRTVAPGASVRTSRKKNIFRST